MSGITFLGTSGSVLTKDRMCAGIMFQDKLIDVGFGVLTNLTRSGIKLDSINDVYISHTHSDHIGDFTGLIWAMAMQNRTKPVRVVSSAPTAIALERILELQATPQDWLKFKINFVRPDEVGTKSMRTIHEPENLAFRFPTGRDDFVYVGDTARFDRVGEFAKGCDLLIHDATFVDGQESVAALTKHSTAGEAGSVAQIAGARRLALTHISPTNEKAAARYVTEASATFHGKIVLAKDLQKLDL